MAVVDPGDGIVELIRSATDRIIIVAPYIKSPAISRILKLVSDNVSELICITRWLPEDIASGVCDLEIFDDITKLKGARLKVYTHLHAKYYSNGQQCLVGSANLTARGLGWHTPSNFELLVKLPANTPGLRAWEESLLSSAVTVTEQLRDQIGFLAEQHMLVKPLHPIPEVEGITVENEERILWIPQCPNPDQLWEVYRGIGKDIILTSTYEKAQKDIAALSPPPGLSQDLFTIYVAGILRQMPLIVEIDKLAEAGLTDDKAHEFLASHRVGANDNTKIWNVIKEWIRHFFPNSYRTESTQEVLIRGRQIPTQ